MNDFAEHIAALGENVKLRDLRCKKIEKLMQKRAAELLAENGTVERVLGWQAGEFFYDNAPVLWQRRRMRQARL